MKQTLLEGKIYEKKASFLNYILIVSFILLGSLGGYAQPTSAPCPDESGIIGGKVFLDFNMNGIDDQVGTNSCQPVIVHLFGEDAEGNSELIGMQEPDEDGFYRFSGLNDGAIYRVEFEVPDNGEMFSGFYGMDSHTSIRFPTAPDCQVDFGVTTPVDFTVDNPRSLAACYVNGNPLPPEGSAGNESALAVFRYESSGTQSHDSGASTRQVGSIYGVTGMRSQERAFVSAFVKRHVGMGPDGIGAIYDVDLSTTPSTVTTLINLATLGVNIGIIPSNEVRGLPLSEVEPSNDAEVFPMVGKIGFGDIDLDDDDEMLWIVNLFNKAVYAIEVDADNDPTTQPTMDDVNVFPLPDPGCENGEFRPFGIKFYRNKVYVGGVCDANMGTKEDLEAIVYELENGVYSEVIRFDLAYEKGSATRSCPEVAGWFPWTDEFPDDCTGNGEYVYPTPILSGIEFDVDGTMILGFMDRMGHQLGYKNYSLEGDQREVSNITGGDIVRVCNDCGTYVVENNGTCGNVTTAGADNNEGIGGGEYYFEDVFTNNLPSPNLYPHSETCQGALVVVPGTGEVASTCLDPYGTQVNSGGINFFNNRTGEARKPGLLLFISGGIDNNAFFGKANGLGGLDALRGLPPLEIGNYVWLDLNEDGIQDPSEPPLEGINIGLFNTEGELLGTEVTDSLGYFTFNDEKLGAEILTTFTDYYLVAGIDGQYNTTTERLNDSLMLTIPVTGMSFNPNLNDSDGLIAPNDLAGGFFAGMPYIAAFTLNNGQNDHEFDFGFVARPVVVSDGSIGDFVFKDCNKNGIQDASEIGIENVNVHLSGAGIELNMLTAENGFYRFDNLLDGEYTLTFTAPAGSNLTFSPQGQGFDPTADSDADADGVVIVTLAASENNTDIDVGMIDDEAPVIVSGPADITLDCNDPIPAAGMIEATDNCATAVDIQFVEVNSTEDCDYTITRAWTASDRCLNSTIHEQTITISDTEGPVFDNLPADMTLNCSEIPAFEGTITASDNCDDEVDITFEETAIMGSGCASIIERTWTATDDCGNATIATQTLSVTDDEAPIITYTNPMIGGLMSGDTLFVECDVPPVLGVEDVLVTDNCDDNPTVTFNDLTIIEGNCIDDGYLFLLTCAWTAIDACGNTTESIIYVAITDNTPPLIENIPESINLDCIDNIPSINNTPTVTDNCTSGVELMVSDEQVGEGCSFLIKRTWTAIDDCGNVSEASQVIFVNDLDAPVFTYTPPALTISCEEEIPTSNPAEAFDNCGEVTITFEETLEEGSQNCEDSYIVWIKWMATDACGNSDIYNQEIQVNDNTPPVFDNIPTDTTLDCDETTMTVEISATDNCDDNVNIAVTEEIVNGDCTTAVEMIRTWTATDNCGNSVTATQSVTIKDTSAPEITSPMDITVACDAIPTADDLEAIDNCGGAIIPTFEEMQIAGDCEGNYTLIRTWTATDACGNSSQAVQTIHVEDATPPVLVDVPEDLTLTCGETIPNFEDLVSAIDNCGGEVEIILAISNAENTDCINGGSSIAEYIWTATDACGNSSSASFAVVFAGDDEAPILMGVPTDDVTVNCGETAPNIEDFTVTASDNCDMDVAITLEAIGTDDINCVTGGSSLVQYTWTATDNCGNATTASFSVMAAIDDTPPTIDGVPNQAINIACGESDPIFNVTASDDCDTDVELSFETIASGTDDCVSGGSNMIQYIWTATDNCGNTATASVFINYEGDEEAPTLLGVPDDITVACGEPIPSAEDYTITASDNCDAAVEIILAVLNVLDVDCVNGGVIAEYTWTATDDCGNMAAATFAVSIAGDEEAPILLGVPSEDITINCGETAPNIEDYNVTATDNCDTDVAITLEAIGTDDINCVTGGSSHVQYTWTAIDNCGNTTTASFSVTAATDNTPPIIAGVPDGDLNVACGEADPLINVTASDDCDTDVELSFEIIAEGTENCVNGGSNEVQYIWTATDNCGNIATASVVVNYEDDEEAPVISDVPVDITVACDAFVNDDPPLPTFSDNCDADLYTEFEEESIESACPNSFILTYTWTAIDDCGNMTQATQTITVVDTTAPVFENIPADVTLDLENIEEIFEYTPTGITLSDNCDENITYEYMSVVSADDCTIVVESTWTATDNCGNTTSVTQTATANYEVTANIEELNHDDCVGGAGSATVSGIGGLEPYNYLWSDGQTTATASNLDAGDYSLTISDQAACSVVMQVTINAANPDDCKVQIGDYVWFDENENGIQDAGEIGVEGIMVKLLSAGADGAFNTADDILVETQVTDNTGHYLFECVFTGTYIIEFMESSLPTGYDYTLPNQGDDSLDSDANPFTGQTDPFTIVEGQEDDFTFDAGLIFECINVSNGGEICCDQEVCGAGGDPELLTSLTPASGGTGNPEYIWMINTTGTPFDFDNPDWSIIPGAVGESYDPGPVFVNTYFIRCARSAECGEYVGETNVIKVTIGEKPNADIVIAAAEICLDEATSFEAQIGGNANDTYTWTFEDATPNTADTRIVNGVVFNELGTKVIDLEVDRDGCSNHDQVTIEVLDCAIGEFEFTLVNAEMMQTETEISLKWDVINEDVGAIYLVEFSIDGDVFEVKDIIQSHTYNGGVNHYEYMDKQARVGYNYYRIKYVHLDGNTTISDELMVKLPAQTNDSVMIYPNPFAQKLQMEIINRQDEEGIYEVFDMIGNLLDRGTIAMEEQFKTIDLTSRPQGVYYVKVKFGPYRARTYKLIKSFE